MVSRQRAVAFGKRRTGTDDRCRKRVVGVEEGSFGPIGYGFRPGMPLALLETLLQSFAPAGSSLTTLMPVTILTVETESTSRDTAALDVGAGRTPRFRIPAVWLSIVDQCLVSGINFLTMIALGRFCGMLEVGVYALAFSVIVVLMSLQESLLIVPFTVMAHRLRSPTRRKDYFGATFRQQLLVGLLAVAAVAVVSEIAWRLVPSGERSTVFSVLAIIAPIWLLKDFARRSCFALLDARGPLLIDVASAAVQSALLAALAFGGDLSATTALASAGAGHAAAIAVWYLVKRPALASSPRIARLALRLNWSLGSWSCASRGAEMLQAYSLHWLLAAVAGPAATGAYASASAILALSNPILMGIGNLLAPETARAYGSGGMRALKTSVMRTTVLVTAVTLALVVLVMVFSRRLLWVTFGEVEPGQVLVIVLLSIATLTAMMSFGAENALRALARPADNLIACLAGWFVSLLVAGIFVSTWNAPGAALGMLAGSIIASLVRGALYLRIMIQHRGAVA